MGTLKLITTEKFGEMDCNFYRNINNDILLTREQVGTALEYANPQKAINNIHSRHKERLDMLSTTLKLRGKTGQEYETTLYLQRGVMEICRWSNKPKANLFMDWTWAIVEKYRSEELNQPHIQPFVDAITAITNTLSSMQQDIVSLKDTQQALHNRLPRKRFSSWTSRMFPKYQLLIDYFEVSRKELYHNLYMELQNLYPEIDLQQEQDDYCYENGLDSCFTLDVIEHSKDLRKLFESVVDNLLHQYGLSEKSETSIIRETIFSRKINQ